MNLRVRRTMTLVPAAAIAIIGTATVDPATAAHGAPVGQCPPVYTLTDAAFGPATMALDSSQTGNGDGWICRMVFTQGPNAGIANIIDNDIPLGVTFH